MSNFKNKKKIFISVISSVLVIAVIVTSIAYRNDILDLIYKDFKAAAPTL